MLDQMNEGSRYLVSRDLGESQARFNPRLANADRVHIHAWTRSSAHPKTILVLSARKGIGFHQWSLLNATRRRIDVPLRQRHIERTNAFDRRVEVVEGLSSVMLGRDPGTIRPPLGFQDRARAGHRREYARDG